MTRNVLNCPFEVMWRHTLLETRVNLELYLRHHLPDGSLFDSGSLNGFYCFLKKEFKMRGRQPIISGNGLAILRGRIWLDVHIQPLRPITIAVRYT